MQHRRVRSEISKSTLRVFYYFLCTFRQWDYCCRPRHSCGFSKGFNYPWCYVGEAGPDQWRPCSEQYYPDFRDRNQYHGNGYGDNYGPSSGRPWSYGYVDLQFVLDAMINNYQNKILKAILKAEKFKWLLDRAETCTATTLHS